MTAKKHRKSAYVPRLLVRTTIVGVVPACAIVSGSGGCGTTSFSVAGPAYDGSQGSLDVASFQDVAVSAYDASFDGVAVVAYPDSGTPSDAPPEVTFSVADAGYRDSAAPDANTDGGSDARPDSRFLGVAAVAYPAYEAGNG